MPGYGTRFTCALKPQGRPAMSAIAKSCNSQPRGVMQSEGTRPTTSAVTEQQRSVTYWILTVLTARSRSLKGLFGQIIGPRSDPDFWDMEVFNFPFVKRYRASRLFPDRRRLAQYPLPDASHKPFLDNLRVADHSGVNVHFDPNDS